MVLIPPVRRCSAVLRQDEVCPFGRLCDRRVFYRVTCGEARILVAPGPIPRAVRTAAIFSLQGSRRHTRCFRACFPDEAYLTRKSGLSRPPFCARPGWPRPQVLCYTGGRARPEVPPGRRARGALLLGL